MPTGNAHDAKSRCARRRALTNPTAASNPEASHFVPAICASKSERNEYEHSTITRNNRIASHSPRSILGKLRDDETAFAASTPARDDTQKLAALTDSVTAHLLPVLKPQLERPALMPYRPNHQPRTIPLTVKL